MWNDIDESGNYVKPGTERKVQDHTQVKLDLIELKSRMAAARGWDGGGVGQSTGNFSQPEG